MNWDFANGFLLGVAAGTLLFALVNWWIERDARLNAYDDFPIDGSKPDYSGEIKASGEINHNHRIVREEDEADWWKHCDD